MAAAAVVDPPQVLPVAKKPSFPFTRIAGQEDMKLALLLNVVDPGIGGVLIMGDRGTGKSVAVRSLVELLPVIDVVEHDPFNSSPTGWSCGRNGTGGALVKGGSRVQLAARSRVQLTEPHVVRSHLLSLASDVCCAVMCTASASVTA